jgi:peroxiredoxin
LLIKATYTATNPTLARRNKKIDLSQEVKYSFTTKMQQIRTIFAFVFLALSQFAIAAPQADSTVIEVFATGLTAGKLKLVGVYGDQNFLADSAVVDANGHFTIRRKSPLKAGYYYFLATSGKNFSVLIDDSEQFITLRTDVKDFAGTMQVTGSLNTDLLYQNFRFQAKQDGELQQLGATLKANPAGSQPFLDARARQDVLMAERKKHLDEIYQKHPNSFFTKFKVAGQNPDFVEFKKPNGHIDTARQVAYYRSRFWDGFDFNDPRLLATPVVGNKLRRYIKELTPQNPDSIIKVSDALIRRVMPQKEYFKFFSNWIALQYENTKTTVMDGEAAYVHIVNNFFTPELAFWDNKENIEKLRKHAWEMEASLLGRKGPDVAAKDQFGVEKSIYGLKSPLVVVFMFSPDCEHCQKDADEIERIYQKYKSRGVEFYGIAVNTNEKEWKDFIAQHKFSFTNVFDPTNRAIYAKYYVDITPELYVLNKDRIIVAKNLHANQLEEVFEKQLKKQ